MRHQLRPFQCAATEDAVEFLVGAQRRERRLYSAPTGVGKSVIELAVHGALPGTAIVTPRDEIVEGMLEKLGMSGADPDALNIWTPVRLRNRLMSGAVKRPERFIIDESHHETAETWQQLDLLTGEVPAVGYTATPYRGSPKGTRQLLERWGEPVPIITFQEAADLGYVSVPTFRMLPLVDDDIVEVGSNGEFAVESLEAATVDRLADLADHCKQYHDGTLWDRPTMFSLPSTKLCGELQRALAMRGLPAAIVNAATPKSERWEVFNATLARVVGLIQINVVSEGVDLRIERLIDAAPTMSPVKWVQQLGRCTRPMEMAPEYICTNRNILRHSYALEGMVPISAYAEAEGAFPPTQRGHARVLGMEAIGRFKPVALKLTTGITAYMYSLSSVVGRAVVEYVCLMHPTQDPIWASKIRTRNEQGVVDWGNWRKCDAPVDLVGFGSVAPKAITDKQRNWWLRSAVTRGLDPTQEVSKKNFQALPVLMDIGERL